MTSARLGQQLTLDFSATVTPASRTQEPLAPSKFLAGLSPARPRAPCDFGVRLRPLLLRVLALAKSQAADRSAARKGEIAVHILHLLMVS